MKSESGFSFAIASQPFGQLHGLCCEVHGPPPTHSPTPTQSFLIHCHPFYIFGCLRPKCAPSTYSWKYSQNLFFRQSLLIRSWSGSLFEKYSTRPWRTREVCEIQSISREAYVAEVMMAIVTTTTTTTTMMSMSVMTMMTMILNIDDDIEYWWWWW